MGSHKSGVLVALMTSRTGGMVEDTPASMLSTEQPTVGDTKRRPVKSVLLHHLGATETAPGTMRQESVPTRKSSAQALRLVLDSTGLKRVDGMMVDSHLKVISDSTVRECEEECVKIPECVGFTFEKRRDECELKENPGCASEEFEQSKSHLWTCEAEGGAAWVNNAGDYVATSRTVVYDIESSLECARHCEGKSGCVAWTYVANYNRCDVKDKDTAHHYTMKYSDVVSGIVIKRY